MNNIYRLLDLSMQSIMNPKKFFSVLKKKYFSIPELHSLDKIQNAYLKRKFFYLWINLSKKNKRFNKLFFNNENDESVAKIDINYKKDFKEFFFENLAKNGVIIFENVLPNDEKKKIQNDFFNLKNFKIKEKNLSHSDWLIKPIETVGSCKQRIYSQKKISDYPNLEKLSDKLTKEISGKVLKTVAEFYFDRSIKIPEEKIPGDNDLHIDRWAPNFKIFYSPFEVKTNGAPFTYLVGSHKINEKYIRMIFDKSYKDIEKHQIYNLKKKTQLLLKENSLVVALTNGFHGRSSFTELNERMLLFLQYNKSFNKFSFFNYKSFNK